MSDGVERGKQSASRTVVLPAPVASRFAELDRDSRLHWRLKDDPNRWPVASFTLPPFSARTATSVSQITVSAAFHLAKKVADLRVCVRQWRRGVCSCGSHLPLTFRQRAPAFYRRSDSVVDGFGRKSRLWHPQEILLRNGNFPRRSCLRCIIGEITLAPTGWICL
jgi:hypothetical protein